MNIKFLKILQLTIIGFSFFLTSEYAYSSTWYICASGNWSTFDPPRCGYYKDPIGPNAFVTLGVRWSYSECKNFGPNTLTIPHKSDVQSTPDTWTSVCEVEPTGQKHSPTQNQKNKQPKGRKP